MDKDKATRLLEEGLHLGMNGERAPGGDETWAEWFRKTEEYLRGLQEAGEQLILVNQFELMSVMQGRTTTVRDTGGRRITVRLATSAELIEQVNKAAEELGIPEKDRNLPTQLEAFGLTRPIEPD